jgi:excisionase family DNA binding protein
MSRSSPFRSPATTAAPSNLTIEQLFAHFQTNMTKLATRLDEIHELVTGHSKEHLTVAEVAEMTGRSAYTVRRWISDGRLKASRIIDTGERGRLLIHREELHRLIGAGRGANL